MNYFEEEEYTNSKFDIKVWYKIFSYMKPFKKNVILGVLAAITLAAIDTISPLINKYAIDEIIETKSLDINFSDFHSVQITEATISAVMTVSSVQKISLMLLSKRRFASGPNSSSPRHNLINIGTPSNTSKTRLASACLTSLALKRFVNSEIRPSGFSPYFLIIGSRTRFLKTE